MSSRMRCSFADTLNPTFASTMSGFSTAERLVAGFSADFVDDALRTYLPRGTSNAWVLDPFAGVGTTLVESYLSGSNVVGFEINPYAALATRIKLNAMKISVHDLAQQIAAFERFMEKAESGGLKRDHVRQLRRDSQAGRSSSVRRWSGRSSMHSISLAPSKTQH
jgi:hypothetical protein